MQRALGPIGFVPTTLVCSTLLTTQFSLPHCLSLLRVFRTRICGISWVCNRSHRRPERNHCSRSPDKKTEKKIHVARRLIKSSITLLTTLRLLHNHSAFLLRQTCLGIGILRLQPWHLNSSFGGGILSSFLTQESLQGSLIRSHLITSKQPLCFGYRPESRFTRRFVRNSCFLQRLP